MPRLVTMKATVTVETRELLNEVCTAQGVTLGAMLESYAELVTTLGPLENNPQFPFWNSWMKRAREITAERRKR